MARTRALLWCGAVGGPLFVLVFLVAGAVRPDYDPIRHPVSSLALTSAGWVQVANFVVTGALFVAFAFGLRHALGGIWAPILVGMVGIGLIGAGVFTSDPLSGYPPGTPDELVYTTEGALHDAFSLPVFLCLPIACLVVAKRRVLVAFSLITAPLFLTGFFLASVGFSQQPGLVDYAGLLQRATIVLGWAWLTVLALRLLSASLGRDEPG